ncbi:MAG TPA: ABC transporter substrate-binding protein [Acidimicrobiia bacterium]|nr:ABC transporter substrate-binding protein [Acidimicrobiia bacterium]
MKRRWAAAGVLVALVSAGCGSHLSAAQFDAADRHALLDAARALPAAARPGATPGAAGSNGAGVPSEGGSAEPGGGPAGAGGPAAAESRNQGLAPAAGPTAASGGPDGGAAAGTGGRSTAASRPRPVAGGGTTGEAGAGETGAAGGPVAPKAEIVLGSFGTGSGPIGANVAEIPVASRAWMADVNARGGLDGHPVRIVYGDDGGDPARAVAIARRMVEQEKVLAFFAVFGPTTLQAVIPYAEQVKVPVIGSTTSQAAEDESPLVFNPQTSLDAIGNAFLATVTTQTPARKIGIVYCREVQGCKAVRDSVVRYAPKVGADIVYEAQISLAQPDFTAEVVAARQAGTEDIIVVADVQTLIRLVRSAKRQNWNPQFSGSHAFDSPIVTQGGADAEGLIAFSTTANFQSPLMKPYRDAVARFVPGGQVSGPGGQAWAQGKLMELVAPQAFAGRLDAAAVISALEGVKDATLDGIVAPVTFSHGPHRDANRCFFPTRFRDGRWTMPLGDRPTCV